MITATTQRLTMSAASKFPHATGAIASQRAVPMVRLPHVAVTRDFAVLVGLCLATGVGVGLSMMLAVMLLA
jgi:hypothetical protein